MARYSKVLTRQNAQMFVGGALLTLASGHLWLQSRKERTAELQERLRTVQKHMYWSMSLAQRINVGVESELALYFRRRREQRQQHRIWNSDKTSAWWNNNVSGLGSWAVKPGYLTDQASLLQTVLGRYVAAGWDDAKDIGCVGSSWIIGQIKDAVRWKAATKYLQDAWILEKTKWQHAHKYAIEKVHPLCSKDDTFCSNK